jgi:DNA invertase Pin-like site-specific DNA recombinase
VERELLKIAIYARVSTKNGQDPEMQLAELREYTRNRRWKIAGEYVDRGISGASDSRPELNRLMADANRRRFDVIAVWKFDRFARSVSHLLRALETFRALGIEFVSLSESIDTSTPTGKMVFTVLASVAELERSLIGERVRAGLRNAKARGTRLGRPPLKHLSVTETQRLRRERRKLRTSFKELAGKYGVSVWTAFQLCKRTKAQK